MKKRFTHLFFQLIAVAMLMPLGVSAQNNEGSEILSATFEELSLGNESFWNGSDESGAFTSGSFTFKNSFDPQYKSWGGFAYSNVTTTDFVSFADKSAYGNVTGSGHNSANYAVCYCFSPSYMDVNTTSDGEIIDGFYITNSNYSYSSMTKGDGYSNKYEKGDYLLLTITDTLSHKKVEYYLADFRSENEADHFIVDTWQWVDLRPLGKVKSLEFVVTGSQNDPKWGLKTPAYFCMDDVNGKKEYKETSMQFKNAEGPAVIDLTSLFTFEDNTASVTYSFDGTEKEYSDNKFEVKGSNLIVSGGDGLFRVYVKAVQKGKAQYISIPVIYSNKATTATFEDLTLEKDSFWNGADLSGAFYSGPFKFKNSFDPKYSSWGGFAYSNVTTTDFVNWADKSAYGNVTGGGRNSDNYATVYCFMPAYMDVLNSDEGRTIDGFYVTNSNYSYSSMIKDDGYSYHFEKGDFLLLTITDTLTNKKVEYYLADYRSDNEADHYILDTWQWVDLRPLGNVHSLKFVITGSQNDPMFGLKSPAYFCMDDFNGKREITEVPAQTITGNEGIDLAQFFTFENSGATIQYSLDEYITDGAMIDFTITDGKLQVVSSSDSDFKLIIKAVQRGKVQYVMIPVTYCTSINNVESSEGVQSVYTLDGMRVNSNSMKQGVNIIRKTNGEIKKVIVR